MGIPKFFRWLSERYPLCSQLVTRNMVPEFDNLYLDMNGIIHNCAKEYDPEKEGGQRTEEEIFVAIFAYIQTLFEIIRPQKLFFLAVDGVAPRAKMNQQRSRRFRAAKEAEEEAIKEARRMAQKGIVKSATQEPKFDGNCITPGTDFMDRMAQHLRYFIAKRVNEEASWQNIEIIFSGPDVPGEGEHKIMEYIRCSKAQPTFNPNLRHCLYGLDADLILLGLLSHEPHFALLREEVLFGPASRKPRTLAQTRFFLMHLGLLRDYMDEEFRSYYQGLDPRKTGEPLDYTNDPFPHYSVERIIDDFILMTVFVGNDFLPGLPYLHIGENAIGIMFDAYKKVLYSSGGNFMNNAGQIDFKRAGSFLKELCYIEREHFEQTGVAIKFKQSVAGKTITSAQKELYEKVKKELLLNETNEIWHQEGKPCTGKDKTFAWKLAHDFGLKFVLDENRNLELSKGCNNDDSDSDVDDGNKFVVDPAMLEKYDKMVVKEEASGEVPSEEMDVEFSRWKSSFYKEKLHLDTITDPKCLEPLLMSYLTGIQWNMYYYYKGIVDWAWYYPYHYGPYLTDVADFMGTFECAPFEMGTPYRPLEQLLAVLPAASAAHVPTPFAELMASPYSPIIDFYPKEFEQDLNGKKSPWEAVVLIPFIDEVRLLASVETVIDQLSAEEKRRNEFGSSMLFTFDPAANEQLPPPPRSPYTLLSGLQCKMVQYDLPVLETEYSFNPELLPGLKPLAGFPTLRNLPHRAHLDTVGIALFGGKPTSNISLVLSIDERKSIFNGEKSVELLAKELCGQRMYSAWPFLHEGVVVRLTDSLFSYDAKSKAPLNEIESKDHARSVASLIEDHRRLMAVELDDIEVLVWMTPLTGMKREADGSTKKAFAHVNAAIPFPGQTVLPPSVCIEDPRYLELEAKSLEEEYPIGSMAVYIGPDHYGCMAKVTSHSSSGVHIEIERRLPLAPEPSFPHKIAVEGLNKEAYYPARVIADRLGLNQLFLSKITSTWYLFHDSDMDKSSNIGLGLKFEGRGQRAAGYARRSPSGWEFSERAINLIKSYQLAFPELFTCLQANVNASQTQAKAIFGPDISKATMQSHMAPIHAWLKQNTESIRQIPIDTVLLDPSTVLELNQSWIHYMETHKDTKIVKISNVDPKLLRHEGMAQFAASSADSLRFQPGDRVRYLGSGAAGIPFGISGMIVGLDGESSGTQLIAHILIDEPLIGVGKTLGGLCPPNYGISVSRRYLINLNSKESRSHPPGANAAAPPRRPVAEPVVKQFAKMNISSQPGKQHASTVLPAHSSADSGIMPPNLSALFTAVAAKEEQRKAIHHSSVPPAKTIPGQIKIYQQKPNLEADRKPPVQVKHFASAPTSSTESKPKVVYSTKPAASAPTSSAETKPTVVYSTKRGLLKPDLSWTK